MFVFCFLVWIVTLGAVGSEGEFKQPGWLNDRVTTFKLTGWLIN